MPDGSPHYPEAEALAAVLARIFPEGRPTLLGRRPNPLAGVAPSEILTCRFIDGRETPGATSSY